VSEIRYVNLERFARAHAAELDAVIARVLRSGIYVGGDEVAAFERDFAAYCGARYAIGVANGLEALELTLRAWEIGAGDEVVVPDNTAVPTALAVTHTGARAVFVDVEPDTGLMSAEALEAALTARTRAAIPVHLYGHAVDMDPIRAVAAAAGVRVLEDAAHAHGALYRDRLCGSLGDAAAFSFYPTKNLGALGDAGCVTTDDAGLADELRLLRSCGLTERYRHVRRGFNSRLDPVQAALLGWKLSRLDAWNDRRRDHARAYLDGLAGVADVTLPAVRPWATPVWHAFPILVGDGRRDELRRALGERGVQTNVHYPVPLHLQPCYAGDGGSSDAFPVSEGRALSLLSLPLDPFHTGDEIATVVAAVRDVLE
jgi:dTDP-3-amino-3,4,6-trideoxy-alpha-D-glucose transaminase